MASIYQTDAGTWRADIRRKGWPKFSKTLRLKIEAEKWATTTEDQILRGIYFSISEAEKVSIADALTRYLKEVSINKAENTRKGNVVQARQLSSMLGQYTLANLNSTIIATYRDTRLKQGLSNNTVRLELALLGHLYSVAIKEWGLGLTINPVANVKKPAAGHGRNRRLEGDEEQRLLEACDQYSNPLLGWIVRIALYSAMRKTEVLTLTQRNINMSMRTVTLFDTKNKYMRTVPMTDKAHNVFAVVLENPFLPGDTDLLFYGDVSKRDNIRHPYDFKKAWSKSRQIAQLDNFTFHDLRHEATSRLVEANLSDQQVMAITGHSSAQMVRRYTHLRGGHLVDLVKHI